MLNSKIAPQSSTEFNTYSDALQTLGHVVLSAQDSPWTMKELESLEKMTTEENLPYRMAVRGDTNEKLTMLYFRMRHPTIHETSLPACMELIEKETVKDFFSHLTGLPHYTVDRCQSHIYKPGDYIAKHIDAESEPAYRYSALMILGDKFQGGDFITYPKNHPPVILKLKKFDVLITDSNDPHEVLPITEGERRSLVFFFRPC